MSNQPIASNADALQDKLSKLKKRIKLTERQNQNSKEHSNDIAADIVTFVMEGDTTTIFKCMVTTPPNYWRLIYN